MSDIGDELIIENTRNKKNYKVFFDDFENLVMVELK